MFNTLPRAAVQPMSCQSVDICCDAVLDSMHPQIASCSHTIYFQKNSLGENHVAPFKNQTFDPHSVSVTALLIATPSSPFVAPAARERTFAISVEFRPLLRLTDDGNRCRVGVSLDSGARPIGSRIPMEIGSIQTTAGTGSSEEEAEWGWLPSIMAGGSTRTASWAWVPGNEWVPRGSIGAVVTNMPAGLRCLDE